MKKTILTASILFIILISLFINCSTNKNPIGPLIKYEPEGTTVNLNNYILDRTILHYDFNGQIHGFNADEWVSYWSDIPNTGGASGFCENPTGMQLEWGFTNIRPDFSGWFWGHFTSTALSPNMNISSNIKENEILAIQIRTLGVKDFKFSPTKLIIRLTRTNMITNLSDDTMERSQSVSYKSPRALPSHWTNMIIPYSDILVEIIPGYIKEPMEEWMGGPIVDWSADYIMAKVKDITFSFSEDEIILDNSCQVWIDDFKIVIYRRK